jgi:transcription elongation factor Elf1
MVLFGAQQSSTSTTNTNEASTSQHKYKVKFTCSHCGRDVHKVEFCLRLDKQQRKERAKASSNFNNAHFVPHNGVSSSLVY